MLLLQAGKASRKRGIRFLQPWHLFSGIVTRSILAASATEGGRDAALTAMAGIFARREDFEFESTSPARTPHGAENIFDISASAGVALCEP